MNWIKLLPIIILAGCAQVDKTAGVAQVQEKQEKTLAEFEKANALLDNKQYEDAAKIYEMLIVYNAGISHLLNLDCETAEERFRKVIRMANQKLPELAGRTLLRLSEVYTCLGADNKSIVNLIELSRGKYNLPPETIMAEVPAKLAAAYARIGNQKVAEQYFRKAEKGLLYIQNNYQDVVQKREVLSKTLYLMGNISQINTKNMSSSDYFATLRAMQKYLYKAVEFNEKNWSVQAADQITTAYENTWNIINKITPKEGEDAAISQREATQEQIHVAQDALVAIKYLYQERVPDPDEPEVVKQLMNKLSTQESKIRNFLATNIVGTSLTPQALEAEGVKRAGRVLNPDPFLEKQSLKKRLQNIQNKKKK
jgi:tetratricopeptide (TPR) repeat protein